MATIEIKNLPDELYNHIQSLAVENNLTLSEVVISLLQQASQQASPSQLTALQQRKIQSQQIKPAAEILQQLRSRRRVNPTDFGFPDSTVLIREDRDR